MKDSRPALLDHSQCDRALRDLMPLVEWLTNADAAAFDGATGIALDSLREARKALHAVPATSPAIKAYIRWLEQNTELGVEGQ